MEKVMKKFKVTIYPFKPILSLDAGISDAEEIARIREMCASDDPPEQFLENGVWDSFCMRDLFYGCDSLCITDMETDEDVFSIDDISSLDAETFVLEKFSTTDLNPGEYRLWGGIRNNASHGSVVIEAEDFDPSLLRIYGGEIVDVNGVRRKAYWGIDYGDQDITMMGMCWNYTGGMGYHLAVEKSNGEIEVLYDDSECL